MTASHLAVVGIHCSNTPPDHGSFRGQVDCKVIIETMYLLTIVLSTSVLWISPNSWVAHVEKLGCPNHFLVARIILT